VKQCKKVCVEVPTVCRVPVCRKVWEEVDVQVCKYHRVEEKKTLTYTVCVPQQVTYKATRTVRVCVPQEVEVTCTRMVPRTVTREVADCAPDCNRGCDRGCDRGRLFHRACRSNGNCCR
jgi:hypothetical protein